MEDTQELRDYFKFQFLKIDFIDESVDIINQPDVSDYIGSVRIPFSELAYKNVLESSFPVINEKNQTMGDA